LTDVKDGDGSVMVDRDVARVSTKPQNDQSSV
jgi:hypothetical protein